MASVLAALPRFFYSQLFITPPYPKDDFTGQTIIITGSNVGLGLEAARHITRLNAAKVILAVRTISKGEAAKASIEKSTGKKGVVEVWSLDLSSFESVRAFVRKAETLERLDSIVENAGISTMDWAVCEDNESTVTVNVISTFLLALMILPKLRETAVRYKTTPRLVIVSSEVHRFTNLPEKSSPSIFEKLNDEKNFKKLGLGERYNVSKLLEVFYCRTLAAKMTDSKKAQVTLNFLNPGLCHSELVKEPPLFFKVMKALLARTTEVGSRTLVASAVAGHDTHGHYMSDSKATTPSPFVRSTEGARTQARVWEELNVKLEAIQPGILANI